MTDIPTPPMPGLPAQHHLGQYNLTEDDMHIVASCSCGWRTQPFPIADATTWVERSAGIQAASTVAAEKLVAHLEGYPCPGCAGAGSHAAKPWEPPVVCTACHGSGTSWPNKPEPRRPGRRRR
jgi:hypothetical protein